MVVNNKKYGKIWLNNKKLYWVGEKMNNQREIDRYETMERAIDEEIEQAQ